MNPQQTVVQIIADIEAAFNRHDADASVAHFTDDVVVGNVLGKQVIGLEAVREEYRRVLRHQLANEYARYTVEHVQQLRPDVAVVHVVARSIAPDGTLLSAKPQMRAMYVLVNEQGRWRVAARQNTLVQVPA